MFSLIITIISIALVAALALATIYYGGSSFNRGSAEAKASQLINEGQQINGAVAMAKADFASGSLTAEVATVAGLAPNYLAQVPASWDSATNVTAKTGVLTTKSAVAANDDVSVDVCKEIEKKATGVLPETLPTAATAGQAYGCFDDATNGNTVFFRF